MKTSLLRASSILAAILFAANPVLAADPAEKPVSVVLVHGAWVDGSGWRAVHDLLVKDGYEVLVVQNPTLTLEGDVVATQRAIADAKHPVVLVGHSYGGNVITVAGNDPKVRTLAYVAAFVPDEGESVHTLVSKPHLPGAPAAPALPPRDGLVTLDRAKMPMAFAADVDPALASFLADSQVPWGQAAMTSKITAPAWKSKPIYFLMTTQDHIIPPALQREMAERAKAKVTEVSSSHAVMLSHPEVVVKFIEGAVESSDVGN